MGQIEKKEERSHDGHDKYRSKIFYLFPASQEQSIRPLFVQCRGGVVGGYMRDTFEEPI